MISNLVVDTLILLTIIEPQNMFKPNKSLHADFNNDLRETNNTNQSTKMQVGMEISNTLRNKFNYIGREGP